MLINQVSRTTGLTKKAIEYYTMQGLVAPAVLENGYRDYSPADVGLLQKISILRRLDLSTHEIKRILLDPSNSPFKAIAVQKELMLQRDAAKKALLDQLDCGASYDQISAQLHSIDLSQTITEKLLAAFPGYYGRLICMHFARFLNQPIATQDQQTAYATIIEYLDNAPTLSLPKDLQDYIVKYTDHMGTQQIADMIQSTKHSIENPDAFLSSNKEMLDAYLAYKQSDEYKNSPAFKLMEAMKEFNSTSGYYDVFLPALKRLSPSYAQYCAHMEVANEKLLKQYPQAEHLS